MKYQQKLQEFGMSEQKLSPSIQKTIATLNDIISTYNQAKIALDEATDDEEINDINSDLQEMEGDIEDLDNSLVDKIEVYNQNKDVYAEKARKMQEGRKAKASESKDVEQVAVASATKPAQAPQQAQAPKEAPYVEAKEVSAEQPKKKTNWALWIVAGIVAVVTVNQVMIRNED